MDGTHHAELAQAGKHIVREMGRTKGHEVAFRRKINGAQALILFLKILRKKQNVF